MDTNTNIVDPVFGELAYYHSWVKEEAIGWWGQIKVKIIVTAYKGEGIEQRQRDAYLSYKESAESIISSSIGLLESFIAQEGHNATQDTLMIKLQPSSVVFEKDGSWLVLFDSDWDVENGVALYIATNGELKVGAQDEFL
jgi:hypothetical protein